MARFSALAFLVVAACGSNDNNHPADGSSPPKDAASDAPADGPPSVSALVINDGTGAITTWAAPSAFVSSTSSGRVFIYNTGSVPTDAITTSFGGADAADFAVDTATSTCGTPLAGHDGCWVQIRFSPTVAGTKSATFAVSGGGTAQTIGLTAVAPPSIVGLTTDLAAVDFGTPIKNASVQRTVLLENQGAASVTLGTRTASGPFTITDNCPATLTSGGACTMTVMFSSANTGHFTGTLAVTSDANNVSIPLQATTLRSITVQKLGDGTGTVTSLPAGITCGATCSSGFVSGIDVLLTSTPDVGMVFGEWDGICSGASTCTVSAPTDGVADSYFANASDKKINITFAGTGHGNVVVYAGVVSQECFASCTVYVPNGTAVQLYGESPSTFVGWAGDCTGTAACNLGNVINDRNVTATNNKDTYEATTLFAGQEVRGVAVTSTGDLIVGAPHDVSKMSIAGTVAWTTVLTDNVEGLVTDSADEVFVVGGASITKLTAAGAVSWTKPITAGRQTFANNAAVAVSPDGTVIAVLTSTGLRALDASGDDRFSIVNASRPTSVAVAADHTIALGEENVNIGDSPQAAFYMPDGTPIAPYVFSGSINTAIAFDSGSNLLAVSSGGNLLSASRYAAGSQSFIKYESASTALGPFPIGVVSTTSGELVKLRRNQDATKRAGYKLDVYGTTGTVTYSTSKLFDTDLPYLNGVQNNWIASGPANRVVIGGMYGVRTGSRNWIQVLDLP